METKWIPCSERLPVGELQVYVLCHVEGCSRPRLLSYYNGPQPRWYDEEDNQFHGTVLAWTWLPQLPKPPSPSYVTVCGQLELKPYRPLVSISLWDAKSNEVALQVTPETAHELLKQLKTFIQEN